MTEAAPGDFRWRAMASPVQLLVPDLPADLGRVLASAVARDLLDSEQAMSRFWASSDLWRANSSLGEWVTVPRRLVQALALAERARRITNGLFDAAVLTTLEAYGYPGAPLPASHYQPPSGARVRLAPRQGLARLEQPIDLGGIGKGLALRWAGRIASEQTQTFLLNAGGDIVMKGGGGDGAGWLVGVEDPFDLAAVRAVLRLSGDLACCTSSLARRRWLREGRQVHHLIDPRTQQPAEVDLMAVTVVGPDPAWAEVYSKVLFMHGSDAIAERAGQWAVLWIDAEGRIGWTEAMQPLIAALSPVPKPEASLPPG